MTRRAVFIVSLIVVLASFASVAYRLNSTTPFDSVVWKSADEPSEFFDRREMMPEINRMFEAGTINSKETAAKYLGQPQRPDSRQPDFEDENIWLYDLGGERSPSAPTTDSWLELTFDSSGKLLRHTVTQQGTPLLEPGVPTGVPGDQ